MLRIKCPYCGTRDQDEFRFGAEASITRPADPGSASDHEWGDYLFYRDNIKGVHRERWLHRYGCGRWFVVTRDTANHDIREVSRLDASPTQAGGIDDDHD